MQGPFHITAEMEVRKGGYVFLDRKRIDLLRCIRHTGSIRSAAMAMNLSYQQAWSYIKVMNTLSPLPLVTKRRGGSKGGGAEVTNYGISLIRNFLEMEQKHSDYLQKIDEEWASCML